ncbi:MAG: hypothetical protein ABI239_05590 [Aquihabitans sp.]
MSFAESVPDVGPDQQTFNCPRCTTEVSESWYGPCQTCRSDLRSTLGGEKRDLAVADYEPKMNVTPNAVATKD